MNILSRVAFKTSSVRNLRSDSRANSCLLSDKIRKSDKMPFTNREHLPTKARVHAMTVVNTKSARHTSAKVWCNVLAILIQLNVNKKHNLTCPV